MKIPCALFMDTVSIQGYIFQSNKLKTHLGGSQIVQDTQGEYIKSACRKMGVKFDLDTWKIDPDTIPKDFNQKPVQAAYAGGGNVMLFTRDKTTAENLIYFLTRDLLIKSPGLQTVFSVEENLDLNDFKVMRDRLVTGLNQNKYRFSTLNLIPCHGITARCTLSGLSVETADGSSGITAKIKASKKFHRHLKENYKDLLGEEYTFTRKLDHIGQKKGEENHIAVVHIDGNDIGSRFKEAASLSGIRKLSRDIDQAVKQAFRELVAFLIEQYENIMEDLGHPEVRKGQIPDELLDHGKKILPICPVILGGDDITFVCDGRLGIFLAKTYIQFLEQAKLTDQTQASLTACAGVAIAKTKSRFHKLYLLAEELCHNAKKFSRDNNNLSCLDFHINTARMTGCLKEIREIHYSGPCGSLLFRPYLVTAKNDSPDQLAHLLRITAESLLMPKTRINDLEQVLYKPDAVIQEFITQLEFNGLSLPEIETFPGYSKRCFVDSVTPYLDMIEARKFYPESQLTS